MALTHAGGVFSICTTPQTPTLNQAAFEALSYVQVGKVVELPELAATDNMLTQATLDTDISQRQKGIRSVEGGDLVVSFTAGDAGQEAMKTAAASQNIYACKYELNDSGGTNGTTFYFLAVIGGGGGVTGGGREDFVNRRFQLAPTDQDVIEVDAA